MGAAYLGLGAAVCLVTSAFARAASAQEAATPSESEVADLRAQWSQFSSAVVAGEAEGTARYGGRIDGYVRIDGEAANIADGLTINVHGEFIYGESINRVGARTLLPVNTAMNFPVNDDEGFDLSINLVQRIGRVRLQAGKINLLDASSAVPILAGGGKIGFQHIGLAASPGLIAGPKILGAFVTVPAGRIVLNAGVWTPESWIQKYEPDDVFDTGVSGMVAALMPAKISGRQAYHTITVFATSRRPSSEGLPDVRPPDGSAPLLSEGRGGIHVRYAVQQYLWQDPANPARGWGFFGHFGYSLGSPALLDWSMTAGIAGNPPLAARPRDRFGIGYFRFSLKDNLVDGLAPVLPLGDEQGGEIYYSAAVGKALQLTLSAQVVDPILARAATSANINLRAVVDF